MSGTHKYDNEFSPTNVYGLSAGLLARQLPGDVEGAVHLDLACGFGHIAEHLVEAHKLDYVGVDVDPDSLAVLGERGFETHVADLVGAGVLERLREILAGRRLASVTFLDGLEHLTDGSDALAALGTLLAEHRAVAVISVPNVTHYDVGVKTLLGSWTYTPSGLLDETHYQLYSATSLELALRRAGLRRIDEDNVVMAKSDQHFPVTHIALSETSPIGQWLRSTRREIDEHAVTNQFVWALAPVPPVVQQPERLEPDVFLSVIMRTQGRRPQEMREALLSLAGQTSEDFEVLVIAHKTTVEEQIMVEQLVEEQPPSFRDRIRVLTLDRGGRSAPLNLGLAEARGRYIGILDDDDIVFGHWVHAFALAEERSPGRVLRSVVLLQDADLTEVRALPGVKASSSPRSPYNPSFSLAQHLYANQSPTLGWVVPRSLVDDFGFHFDDSMTTTEDWHFLLRAAELAGVADTGKATSIYRWYGARETSRTHHSTDEWMQNQTEIERRLDAKPLLLPAGETRELRRIYRRLKELETRNATQARDLRRSTARISRMESNLDKLRKNRTELRAELRAEKGRTVRLRKRLADEEQRGLWRRLRARIGRLRRR